MNFLKMMFSDTGEVSSTRVMSMLSLLAGIGIAFYGMSKPVPDMSGLTMICGMFVGIAFTGKVTSKMVEASGKTTEENNK